LLALVLLIFLFVAANASPRVPNEVQPSPETSHPHKQGEVTRWLSEETAFAQQQPPPPAQQPERTPPQQQDSQNISSQSPQPTVIRIEQASKWSDPIVIAALLVAGIYAAILIVYIYQLMEMRKTTQAAQESANVAVQYSATADTNARRQFRAYVHASLARPVDPRTPRAPIAVAIKNFGRTPAYNVRAWMTIAVGPYPLPPNTHLKGPDQNAQFSSMVLAPGDVPMKLGDTIQDLPEERRQQVGTPTETVYVQGEIRYEDGFSKDRWTKYRYVFGGPWGAMWSVDVEGNDSDRDP
jgi:hypothetical protein